MRRRITRTLFSCWITSVAMCTVSAAATAAQSTSAGQLLHAAISDASARGSVHESETGKTAKLTVTFSDDVAMNAGRQDIVVSGGWHARVLVLAGSAYLSGNQGALIHYFGFPASVARQIGTGWVSIPPSNSGYSTVASNATLASALSEITPTGPLTETAATNIDGVAAIGIRGKGPSLGAGAPAASLTVYVSRAGAPLPLRASYSDSKGNTYITNLSDWGEHLSLSPPVRATPISMLEK